MKGYFGIDSIIKGIFVTKQQASDIYYHDSIRNFLFEEPGRGGLDLCVLDIIRARDHGIPDYNSIRKEIGLMSVTEFDEISSDQEVIRRLSQTYRNVDELGESNRFTSLKIKKLSLPKINALIFEKYFLFNFNLSPFLASPPNIQ